MKKHETPAALIIIDGWGYRKESIHNAITTARPKQFNEWWETYPHTTLAASGEAVGTLPGFAGNSQIGHITLGAGRIIQQPLAEITRAMQHGTIHTNTPLDDQLSACATKRKRLHLIGLLSDGGVHSHEFQVHEYLRYAVDRGITEVYVHAFLDGRDVPPKSAAIYLNRLEAVINNLGIGMIGSITGRSYAMDRDWNWDRTINTYTMLCGRHEPTNISWQEVLHNNYEQSITDEFIQPTLLKKESIIHDGDELLCFNFRADRMRQLTSLFCQTPITAYGDIITTTEKNYAPYPDTKIPSRKLEPIITAVTYHPDFNVTVLYPHTPIQPTLSDCLSNAGYRLFTCAETQKYAHLTYFFNGGREIKHDNETRVLIPSLPVATYTKNPCMSAPDITQAIANSLENDPHDFYIINYANADMVGHSGNFEATVQAIQCLDEQLAHLHELFIKTHKGTLYVTSDHGNAELMWNEQQHCPHTSHTTSNVPFIVISADNELLKTPLPRYSLSECASYILATQEIPVPPVMQ